MRTAADVLRSMMDKLRSESGSTDPMEPFAYDASWEELAKEADAVLAVAPAQPCVYETRARYGVESDSAWCMTHGFECPNTSSVSARAAIQWKRGDQRVVCAALRDSFGRIVTGARHFDAVMMEQIKRGGFQDDWKTADQGFIDQLGNYLTREEARVIAEAQGQILDPNGGGPVSLYSENLY
jgi:hypothetical protein